MLRKSKKEKIHLQYYTVFIYTISLYYLFTSCIIYINTVAIDGTYLTNIKCKNAVDVTCIMNARRKKWKDDVKKKFTFISAQFSCSVVSDSLWPHGPQHARPPCPSPTPGVYPNSCPLSPWCHLTISSSRPLLIMPSIFPNIRVFLNESALHIRWPKYWSFSLNISPSIEHPELISFRMDWLDLLAVQRLSKVFSNTTVQKHQFFRAQLSL